MTCLRESSVACVRVLWDRINYWPIGTALRPKRPESSPQIYIPEIPVYLPDNNLSLPVGSDMSVGKFRNGGGVMLRLLLVGGMGQAWEVKWLVQLKRKCCTVLMLWKLNSDSTEDILFSVPRLPKHQGSKIGLSPFSSLKFFRFQACLQSSCKRQL